MLLTLEKDQTGADDKISRICLKSHELSSEWNQLAYKLSNIQNSGGLFDLNDIDVR